MTPKFTARTQPFLELLKIAKEGLTVKQISCIFTDMQKPCIHNKLMRLKEQCWITRKKNTEHRYEYSINERGLKKLVWLKNRVQNLEKSVETKDV